MFASSVWNPRGTRLKADLQRHARPVEQGLHGHGDGCAGIVIRKFHRDINIGEIVIVREGDGSLGMREVVGVAIVFGPGIRCLNVLERAPMLQQYLHKFAWGAILSWDLIGSIIHVHQYIATNSRSVSMRSRRAAATGLRLRQ